MFIMDWPRPAGKAQCGNRNPISRTVHKSFIWHWPGRPSGSYAPAGMNPGRSVKLVAALLAGLLLSACDWVPTWGEESGAKPKYDPVDILIMAKVADLRSTEPEIHKQATKTLVETGARAVPRIIPLLTEENAVIRSRAADVLGLIGPGAKEAVPALVERLQARNERDIEAVLKAIRGIGPGAGEAVPALETLIRDRSSRKEHRRLAGKAIIRIGAAAVPALLQTLSDPDPGYRLGAVRALAKMGAPAEPAREKILALKGDPDDKVKFWARKAIESLDQARLQGAQAKAAVTDDLSDEDETDEH